LCGNDLKYIFEDTINGVINKIASYKKSVEKSKKVTHIFTVGGFSASNYLDGKIKDLFKGTDTILINPRNPQAGIVEGAIYCGIQGFDDIEEIQIDSRRVRHTYGILCSCYNEGDTENQSLYESYGTIFEKHPTENRYDTFYTFVIINEEVEVGQEVFHIVKLQETDTLINILESDEIEPLPYTKTKKSWKFNIK